MRRRAATAVMIAPGASLPRLPPSPNGLRTTTIRVPSSNTASTLTSRDDVGNAGQHVVDGRARVAPAAAAAINRAPSRAASHTVSAISAVASGTFSRRPRARACPGQLGGSEDQQPIAIGWREAHGPHANVGGIKRSALDNKVLVRFTAAFLFTTLSEWAFYIAALVYAFDHSGARSRASPPMALLMPIALAAPAAGKAAQHRRPDRVRLAAYAVQTVVARRGGDRRVRSSAPVAVVVACCGVTAGGVHVPRPRPAPCCCRPSFARRRS